MVALEHAEELVLVLVDVQRRVHRIKLLEGAERAAGRLRARLDDDLDVAETQAFAAVRGDPYAAASPFTVAVP